MTVLTVITESGADYVIDHDKHFWNHRSTGWERILRLKSAKVDRPGLPWLEPDDWEDVAVPVIGRRMYISSWDYWRISTDVVEVTSNAPVGLHA